MIFLYVAVFCLLFIPLPCLPTKGMYHADYISQERTLPIKGIFVLLVFFRYSKDYFDFQNTLSDGMFLLLDGLSAQLIVAPFLFYSGYGIFESIKKKEREYIKGFPKKRLLKTWAHFAICVSCFLIYNLITDKHYSVTKILMSFIGWDSIGNSNWLMFDTFALYIIIYLGMMPLKEPDSDIGLAVITTLSIILGIFLYFFKEAW